MREHKFRGQRVDTKEWVYGGYDPMDGYCTIFDHSSFSHEQVEVIPETVGEYTGLPDKNGKEIYEGSILKQNNNPLDLTQVCFGEFGTRDIETEEIVDNVVGWYLKVIKTDHLSETAPFCYDIPLNNYWLKELDAEIIGNIHDNPELLEAVK